MITVHHLEASRSQRILWLLEELGLPYELKVYARDPRSRLAPPELKKVHPLGKSPVITDGDETIAESGAIIEYLAERYGAQAGAELTQLVPRPATPAHRQCRFWMHYAEGSLMNWLVMKLVFMSIPRQPMPFFVKPIARQLCAKVIERLIEPNVQGSLAFMEDHLSRNSWFAGEALSIADFQMSFAVEAVLTRGTDTAPYPHVRAFRDRINARPAYQRALQRGGPVIAKF